MARKNSIRLPSGRDVGTYLFGFPPLENRRSQPCLAENTSQPGCRQSGPIFHCHRHASPQFLLAVRVGLPVPFVCNETYELGEELVGSYRYQVHLLHWLESNVYDVFQSDERSTSRCIESARTHRARACALPARASDTTLGLLARNNFRLARHSGSIPRCFLRARIAALLPRVSEASELTDRFGRHLARASRASRRNSPRS